MNCRCDRMIIATTLAAFALSPFLTRAEVPEGATGDAAGAAESAESEMVVVVVNGEELTEKMAIEHMLKRVPSYAKLGPAQIQMIYRRYAPAIAAEFIGYVLLKEEARRQGIEVDDQAIEQMFADYKKNPPPGMTFEEALEQRGLSEAEMREKIREDLMIPQLLKTRLGDDFAASDEEIATFYQENKERFTSSETIHAQHILIKVDETDSDEEKVAKRTKLEGIRKQLLAGGDFAALAAANSDCPSKQKGGDLGRFGRGRMVKEFDEAAFTQKPEAIGEIVESQFGYHVIQVLSHDPGGMKSLAEAREEIAAQVIRNKRGAATQKYLDDLRANAIIEYPSASVKELPPAGQ